MFTTDELNKVCKLNSINDRLLPFHFTHLKLMTFRQSEINLFKSFSDYAERIKTYPIKGLSFSGISEKEIVCCFGLIPIWHGVYEAWLIPSLHISNKKFVFHRASLRFFKYVAKKLSIHRIQINVSRSNYLAYKWAKSCYFLEEGILEKFGPDKSDYYMMSRLFN